MAAGGPVSQQAAANAGSRPRAPILWPYKLVYAAPAFALAAAGIFHMSWMTKYYVDDLGLGPRLFAISNAVVRSVGLFGYPFFGWLSDNLYVDAASPAVRGRRRPLLLASAPVAALALWLLYAAPALPAPQLQAWYCLLAIIYNAVPLTLTYWALGTEVIADYDEQASIFGYVQVLSAVGMIAGSLLPGYIASQHTVPHTVLFPIFALVIAAVLALLFVLLVAQSHAPDSQTRLRPDDGRLWEQVVTLNRPKRRQGRLQAARPPPASADGDSGSGSSSPTSNTLAHVATAGVYVPPEDDDGEMYVDLDVDDPCHTCIIRCGERTAGAAARIRRRRRFRRRRAAAEAADAAAAAEGGGVESDGDGDEAVGAMLRRRPVTGEASARVQFWGGGGGGSSRNRAGSSSESSDGEDDAHDDEDSDHEWLHGSGGAGQGLEGGTAAGKSSPPSPTPTPPLPSTPPPGVRSTRDTALGSATGDDSCAGTCGRRSARRLRRCARRLVDVFSCGFRRELRRCCRYVCACGAARSAAAASLPCTSSCSPCCGGARGESPASDLSSSPAPAAARSCCGDFAVSLRRALCPGGGGGCCAASSAEADAARNAEDARTSAAAAASQVLLGMTADAWTVVAWPPAWRGRFPMGVVAASLGTGASGNDPARGLQPLGWATDVPDNGISLAMSGSDAEDADNVSDDEGDTPPPTPTSQRRPPLRRPPTRMCRCPLRVRRATSRSCRCLSAFGEALWVQLCCLTRAARAAPVPVGTPVPPQAAGSDPRLGTEAVVLARLPDLVQAAASRLLRESRSSTSPSVIAALTTLRAAAASKADDKEGDTDIWVVVYPRNGLALGGGGDDGDAGGNSSGGGSGGGRSALPLSSAEGAAVGELVMALLANSRAVAAAAGTRVDRPLPLLAGARWALRSIPFRVLLAASIAHSLAMVLARALLAFYVEYVLQPPSFELWLGIFITAELLASVVATPLWYAVSERWDQKSGWLLAQALALPAVLVTYLLIGAGDAHVFVFVTVWTGLTEGGAYFLTRALRSSVIDYDTLYLGYRREAQYVTYTAIATHWVDIPAGSAALMALAGAGYVRHAPVQGPAVIELLKMAAVLVPALFGTIAWLIMTLFPITRATHRVLFPRSSRESEAAGAGAGAAADASKALAAVPAQAAPPAGADLLWDPIARAFVFPPALYAAVSASWTLDHFSVTTLRQVLRARRADADAAARAASASAGVELKRSNVEARRCLGCCTMARLADEDGSAPEPPSVTAAAVGVTSAALGVSDAPADAHGRFGARASHCCCPCAHPACYISVVVREALLLSTYLALTGVCIGLIVVGAQPHLENVAWAAMLAFGLVGLLSIFHGLRLRPAARLALITSHAIRRYLRLHDPAPA